MNSLSYFKSLSDITRLRLFNVLLQHELSVNEIVTLMRMGQSRISRHLKIMIDSGILQCRRDGLRAFYSVVEEGPGRRFAAAIGYLLAEDAVFEKDLSDAKKIIADRGLKTMIFFNTIAAQWDRLKQDMVGDFDLNAAILTHVSDHRVAVDLGCGTGELLLGLKERASKVIGVDSSQKMLEQARKRFQEDKGNIELRLGEIEHLPLGNGEADCAVISMVLHHLSDPCAVFSEVCRILEPGGVFIIADFDKHENEILRERYGDHWLGFSKEEIEKWLEGQGFVVKERKTHKLDKSLQLNIIKSISTGK